MMPSSSTRTNQQVEVIDGGHERGSHADTPGEGVQYRAAMGMLIVVYSRAAPKRLGRTTKTSGPAFAFPDSRVRALVKIGRLAR